MREKNPPGSVKCTYINGSETEPYIRHFTERLEDYYWTWGINAFPDAGSGKKKYKRELKALRILTNDAVKK